jgi:Mor family transcriptional regulator
MGYKNVNGILPHGLIRAIQQYIDGAYVYIPRKETGKQAWGTNTGIRQRLLTRNREIIAKRQAGGSVAALAEEYFLSAKAIYKIINTAGSG